MSLKVRMMRPAHGGGDNLPAFEAFAAGCRACGDDCAWTDDLDAECDVAVHPSGPKGGALVDSDLSRRRLALIARMPDRRIVIESPVFRQGIERCAQRSWRLGWNGFLRGECDAMNTGSPPDRWQRIAAEQGIALADPDGSGDDVLVMLQKRSDASVRGVDVVAWGQNVRRRVAACSSRRVVLREHPLERRGPAPPPLAEVLGRAYAVVTHTSLSAVEAICAGKPTWALSPKSLAWPVANHAIEDIETPAYPGTAERLQWLCDLAYSQWTEDEIRRGVPWHRLRRRVT